MSAFRDMVASDLNSVFMDLDMFGEEHRVDGQTITCVIDDKALRDRQGGAEYAVSQSSMLLYAKCDDLPSRRTNGSELMVDGIPYIIDTWDEDMGMATVALSICVNS